MFCVLYCYQQQVELKCKRNTRVDIHNNYLLACDRRGHTYFVGATFDIEQHLCVCAVWNYLRVCSSRDTTKAGLWTLAGLALY